MQKLLKKFDFTIYLAKKEYTDLHKIIKFEDSHNPIEIAIDEEIVGNLFVKKTSSSPPSWTKIFHGVVDPSIFGENSLTGALFATNIKDNIFMITFGQGRHLIHSDAIVMNFGLRVAVNCVNENSLRRMDRYSFETHPKQLREQSGKSTGLQDFGVDVERDLLRAVTGTPKFNEYGERISGMDALKLSIEADLKTIRYILEDTLEKYIDESYKEGPFAWIDHIGEVKDSKIIEKLDELLFFKIQSNEIDRIWLSIPEIIDWDRVVGFKYDKRSPRVYDVRLHDLIETLDGDIEKNHLMRRKIYCVDANDNPVLDRPAYYFIYAELSFEGNTYLLNNGKWYKINHDYAAQINEYYLKLGMYNKSLPIYDDETEDKYNKRVADDNPQEFALLHAKNIKVPGAASPIEPCDLYRKGNEFIHVKRYGGSSVLSHLFNQGLVSGDLFQMDNNFRKQFNDELPDSHKISDIVARPAARKYTVVFAIISEQKENLTLPFFSKVSLKHAVNRLEAIGFNVKIAKIPVSEVKKKTQVVPSSKKRS